jgi:hypothetical protein
MTLHAGETTNGPKQISPEENGKLEVMEEAKSSRTMKMLTFWIEETNKEMKDFAHIFIQKL